MGNLFISYAHEDHERVGELVQALNARGFQVWWDKELPQGADWDERIQRALEQSSAVFVVWSKNSMASREVRAEATYALNENKLLPIRIEDVKIWARYAIVQYRDLFKRPVNEDPNWAEVINRIEERMRGLGAESGAVETAGTALGAEAAPAGPKAATVNMAAASTPRVRGGVVIPPESVAPATLAVLGVAAFGGWLLGDASNMMIFYGAVALLAGGVVTSLLPIFLRGGKA